MQTRNVPLWADEELNEVVMTVYEPTDRKNDSAVVIFPGGGYRQRCPHEGKAYAEFLNEQGIFAVVVEYRVAPHAFPLPLADAQRAIQTVRHFADDYGVDKNKIVAMGSSAGGHLTALLSTYRKLAYTDVADEISKENFTPNGQILCYPVVDLKNEIRHEASAERLLGDNPPELLEKLSPNLTADENTPPAFVWHTFTDNVVDVRNSLEYAKRLKAVGGNCELHIFPEGNHGFGLALGEERARIYASKWKNLMLDWLQLKGF